MVADILEKVGEGVEKVVTPVHDALDPDNDKGNSLPYYLGGTVVVLLALVFLFKDKIFKKTVIRYRKARTRARSMYYAKRRKK